MKIGITCYPTYGGSGVVATELGKALAKRGHQIHFISYAMPMRLTGFMENIFFHEVESASYPLFEFPLYTLALAELGQRYSGAVLAEANAAVILAYGIGALVSPTAFGMAMDVVPPDGLLWFAALSALAYLALAAVRLRMVRRRAGP